MELTRFQKIMLAVLAGMLAGFSLLMIGFRIHPGVEFEGGLLNIMEDGGRTVYSGRAQGTPVTISVTWPTNFKAVVDFTIGTEIHDICEVEYPLDSVQTERGYAVNGIRVTKNGRLLFEGGYDPENEFGWYDANGEWDPFTSVERGYAIGGPYPWRYYETTAGQIVRFAFGPESAARGDLSQFALAVFFSIVLAADIVFHKELFRWRHWAARDPEPSEGYLALERIGWVVLAVIIAAMYLWAMTEIG